MTKRKIQTGEISTSTPDSINPPSTDPKRLFNFSSMGKTYYWIYVYLDGETLSIDKSKIIFTLTDNPFPTAIKIMEKNINKDIHSPEEFLLKELKVSANECDIKTLLNEINYEGKHEEL